jgi:hypothetical protein
MSSVIRHVQNIPTKDNTISTKFVNLTTLSYVDNTVDNSTDGGTPLPIPFTCEDGVLDIRVQNGVQNDLLDSISSVFPVNFKLVRPMGGSSLVRSLGPNFITFMQNLTGFGTNFTIEKPGIMTKVQMPMDVSGYTSLTELPDGTPFENDYLGQFSGLGVTATPPAGDGYLITGSEADAFGTFHVFQVPLTVKYTFSDVNYYMTFHTTFTKNLPIT